MFCFVTLNPNPAVLSFVMSCRVLLHAEAVKESQYDDILEAGVNGCMEDIYESTFDFERSRVFTGGLSF